MGKQRQPLASSWLLANQIFWFLHSFTHHSACKKNYFCTTSLRPPPTRPFKHLQGDVFQLSLIVGYKYVLVIVCLFSGWSKLLPCSQGNALTVAKKLLENVFTTWGIPSTVSSDKGTGQIIQALTKLSKLLGIIPFPIT